MTLAAARARSPDLRVEAADAAADAALLRDLAAAAEIFTPLVALDPPDGLLLDITGCAHLFGGEMGLTARAREKFAGMGLATAATVAGASDCARALARFSDIAHVAPGEEERVARQLPVAALGLDGEATRALRRAGLGTLGDLADRSPPALAARFGQEIVARLRRTLGREDIRIAPLRAPPDFLAERRFAEPLARVESLMDVFEHLAREIAGLLERRARGARVLEADFFRADGAVRRLAIETAQPTRDAASLVRLMRLKIETLADPLDPGFGFDALRLSASTSAPLAQTQAGLDEGGGARREDEAVADLLDRLVARFGRDRVRKFLARDTHDPARAAFAASVLSNAPSHPWPAPEAGGAPARPLTLFDPPQPIEAVAEVPDGPPLRFRWRRVLHEVARAEGPERIAPEWWRARPDAPTRDYYRVEDGDGRRFWLFRQGLYEREAGAPRWFLHGLFA